jgi:hypothetical protein
VCHLHNSDAFAKSSVCVGDDPDRFDLADLAEQISQFALGNRAR